MSSSVKTDLAHCVDLASLQLEAIGLLLQDHDGQLLGVDLLLHGDGHGVDVLGAALGRHLQLRGLGGPGVRGRVSPVEAALLAARHARPANPHHHRDLVLLAAGEAGQRHLQSHLTRASSVPASTRGWSLAATPASGSVRKVSLASSSLYCTVLYCTVLYCTVLYCTVLYCTALAAQNRRHRHLILLAA